MWDENYNRSLASLPESSGSGNENGDQAKEDYLTQALQNIPADKLRQVQEYAKKLRRNSPGMKPERLQRKVLERFKIKLT